MREGQAALAVGLARRALAEDSDDANVIATAGFVLVMVGRDFDAGMAAVRRAAALNPNNALVSNFAGTANVVAGDLDEALTHLERAERLSPSDPAAFLFMTGQAIAHLFAGRYAKAAEIAAKSATINPDWDWTYLVLARAAAEMGELDIARHAVANILRLSPGLTISVLAKTVPFADPSRRAKWLDGLRKAGLPD